MLETDRVPIEHEEEEQRQNDQDDFEHCSLPFSTMWHQAHDTATRMARLSAKWLIRSAQVREM